MPRDVIWWLLERKGVTKGYIDVVEDKYEGVASTIRSSAGDKQIPNHRRIISMVHFEPLPPLL